MNRLLQLALAFDAANLRLGRAVGVLILVMTLVSAFNALSRKLFSISSNAFLEAQWYLFSAVFLLAAGYTLLRNSHVRVDVLHVHLPVRARLWIELLGTALFLIPFALLVVRYGWPYFLDSVANREISLNAGGLAVWPVKLLIPLGFLLLLLQGLSQLVKITAALQGRLPHHAITVAAIAQQEASDERPRNGARDA
ncbi:MAG: TRAP transporter small permease subunit [Burkholderiales bacterium]|nr:TRAP transporter small permease subunit [Burkholderiales bacterium]